MLIRKEENTSYERIRSETNFRCHSSLEARVDWILLGRFSHGHSSLIAFSNNCSSTVTGARCISHFSQISSKQHESQLKPPNRSHCEIEAECRNGSIRIRNELRSLLQECDEWRGCLKNDRECILWWEPGNGGF